MLTNKYEYYIEFLLHPKTFSDTGNITMSKTKKVHALTGTYALEARLHASKYRILGNDKYQEKKVNRTRVRRGYFQLWIQVNIFVE